MIALALIVGCFVLLVFLVWTKRFPLDDVPEPKRSYFFGHLFKFDAKAPYRTLTDWSHDYPRLFKFKIFWTPVVVASKRAIADVLVKQSVEFAGRPQSYRNEIYSEDQSGIAATDTPAHFRARRQCVYMYLNKEPQVVEKLEELSHKAIDRLMEIIKKEGGKPFDGRDMMLNSVIDILMTVLQGEPLGDVEVKDLKSVLVDSTIALERGKSGEMLDMFPWLRRFGNRCYQNLQAVTKLKNQMVAKWFEGEPKHGLISHIKGMKYDDLFKYKIESKKEQHNTVWDLINNGVYPMTSLMSMILNILAHRVDIQEKLRKEVTETVKGGEKPSLEHRQYMPFHQAVLLEACRYGCVVPLGKAHRTRKDTYVGKTGIPYGTEVWTNLWAMHHNDEIWGEKVFNFQPKRFLDDEERLVSVDHPTRRDFLAFGGGYRGCLGEDLAMSRMFLMLARLVQKFKVLPERSLDVQPSMDCRDMVQVGEYLMPPHFKVRMARL